MRAERQTSRSERVLGQAAARRSPGSRPDRPAAACCASCGRAGRGVGAARQRRPVDAEVARGRSRRCERAIRAASAAGPRRASPERRRSGREAPGQRAERVRQHHRVGRAVADAGLAHERLREHVVQAEAGRVDRVAGQQRAERERVAVGLAPRPAARASSRAASCAASVATGFARTRARRLGRVAERVERARRQLGRPAATRTAPGR